MNRRRFIQGGISAVFLPWVSKGEAAPVAEPIYLDIPHFIDAVNFNNPQMYQDGAGVYWAATRGSSNIGGIVWRVDGYVDKDHRGVPTQVLTTDPRQFFALGELQIWNDGFLRYVTIEVDSPAASNRNALAIVAHLVPGWTP